MKQNLRIVLYVFATGTLAFFSTISHAKDIEISEFSRNVTLHVLFHELAHALIHEFELPILANEEAMADSFSTIYITKMMRDQAPDIITSRTQSWLYEDSEVSPDDYDFKGEHLLDIRRAYQTACLFYGMDPATFEGYIEDFGFSQDDLSDCSDTAPAQELGWVRLLEPYRTTQGKLSKNVELIYGEGPMKSAMQASGILNEFIEHVRLFNWPNTIIVHFDHCDVGAFWSRNERKITLCDDYVQRFIDQGDHFK